MLVITQNHLKKIVNQKGFSLIELMVGLVIGLLATLVIMQVFATFEGQKRTTTGTADAQTSGSVGTFSLQRDAQLAGYGLPLYDEDNTPLKCGTLNFDHDNNAGTPNIRIVPIEITDGGVAAGASDIITIRYGTSASGGVATPIRSVAGNVVTVDANMACVNGDVVFAVTGGTGATTSTCAVTMVNDPNLNVAPRTNINLNNIGTITTGYNLACLGAWTEITYQVNANNQLTRDVATNGTLVATPLVDGIVNIQAQYGISSTPNNNQITRWVNATGVWAAPPNIIGSTSALCDAATSNRNCIKAVRVAIVARNGLLEKPPAVSTVCSSTTVANPTGVCAWDATSANPINASSAPTIDLSNTANWDNYRYKVYESITPLRNVIWTRSRL